MNKLLPLILILFAAPCFGENNSKQIFRNVRWYDTLEQVKEKETAEFVEYSQITVRYDKGKPEYSKNEDYSRSCASRFTLEDNVIVAHNSNC